MEPNTARAEANRWLGTSAKLLNGRDLLGSKTFALRAREADPSNPLADQILAVVDTLIASEKRVINATNYDWYSILQLPHLSRDLDVIADQYGRLMMLLNPDHNGLPYADFALRLVVDAWSVLSDAGKKFIYDSELSVFFQRNSTFQVDQTPEPVRVDSASTFLFFQQPPQPQSQQWQTQPEPQRLNRASEQQIPPQPQNQQQPTNNLDAGKDSGNVNNDDCDDDGDGDEEEEIESFWTTCPYCYYTYEYPKTFQDCTLRCQNCRRAFHALQIPNPPQITRRMKETTFCCWGFFPLGVSMTALKRNNPFGSPGMGVKKNVVRKPVVYLDDDDEDDFDEPYSSDDSDSSYDWNSTRKSKKRKSGKSSGTMGGVELEDRVMPRRSRRG